MPRTNKDSDLATQYNRLAESFYAMEARDPAGQYHREKFYAMLDFIVPGARLLDLGCGGGLDLDHYQALGASVCGIDAAEEMVQMARTRLPKADIRVGLLDDLPFPGDHFDIVLSQYAIQTAMDVGAVFRAVHRVLRPRGILLYLAVHPFRQFFEKKQPDADYFAQTIVESTFFQGRITVREPTHTMGDYLSPDFLARFDVVDFVEDIEPAAERVGSHTYPGFFMVKAKKRA